MPTSPSPLPTRLFPLVAAVLMLVARPVEARRNGIQAYSCTGCHSSSSASTLTLTADRAAIQPGDLVEFTAEISAPGIEVGGIFVVPPDLGSLGVLSGQGLILSQGALTHTAPKVAVDGRVSFRFTWQAPAEPGAALLGAYVLAGDGNGQNRGDVPGEGYVNFTYGCAPQTFYIDSDGDGYGGTTENSTLGCADAPAPPGYSATHDDCNDAKKQVYPGAPERCNDKDDDCDGEIDEDTTPTELFPDPDADGFYGPQPGEPVIGCLPLDGYAEEPGDCAPSEPGQFPGAEEVCNLVDDDCDGRTDEFVRPRCGVGRCEVEGPTCNPADCVPELPLTERCNGLDDDCNGVVDDGELCAPGEACLGIRCVALDGGESTAAGGSASGGGATSSAGTSSGAAAGNGSGGTASASAAGGASGRGGSSNAGGSEIGGRNDGSAGTDARPAPAVAPTPSGCGVAARPASESWLLALAVLLGSARWRRRAPLDRASPRTSSASAR